MGRLLLLLIFFGCARDVTKPSTTSSPAFLGDLSGYYRLVLAIPDYFDTTAYIGPADSGFICSTDGNAGGDIDPGGGDRDGGGGDSADTMPPGDWDYRDAADTIPPAGGDATSAELFFYYNQVPLGGQMKVMHLKNPVGGRDPVVAQMSQQGGQRGGEPSGGGAPSAEEPGLSAPGFADVFLYGELEGDRIVARDDRNHLERVEIRRIAGGGALVLERAISICPGGPYYTAYASRVCEFNPALSGVFSAKLSDCNAGSPEQSLHVALGFSDQEMVGISYPATTQFMGGYYSRFDESGSLSLYDASSPEWWNTQWDGGYSLRESDGTLRFSAQVSRTLDARCARLEATRLSGGQSVACNPSTDAEQTLDLRTWHDNVDLFVEVTSLHDAERRKLRPERGLTIYVRAAGQNVPRVQIDEPCVDDESCTESARYSLSGITAATLEVFAYYGGDPCPPQLRPAGWAVPVCVSLDSQ